ncbi:MULTISPECIES: lipocalin family protein [Acinetobacter]|uniref:lipocalin family protein n=1 Tax=Acinetobacter TaxID=469 RepID=UPI0015D0EF8E|nr:MULTISPECIES: lipocalin family protein [Acinetobacter]MDH5818648.1 lipocalin family protein [Acinetobacter pseudolwoffii]
MKKTLLCLALAGLLSACGGSDDNSSTPPASNIGTQTGVLTDAVISGVRYVTSSGATGFTNDNGEFNFNEGETVKFYIGDVQLGDEIEAKERVTPLDLAETENARLNLLVFLQSLDGDDNDDKLQISTATTDALKNQSINFDQPYNDFKNEAIVKTVIPEEKLVNEEDAKAHFQATFYKDIAGTWEINRTDNTAVLIHILEDGRYALGEAEAKDESGQAGIEMGRLKWNATTTVIEPEILLDTNGEWGLSHPAENKPYSLNFNGTQLILTEPGVNTEYRLNRVKQSNSLVGTWRLNETHLFAFFDNNYYFFLDTEGGDDCGWPGIEYGKYTLSANTLTTTEVLFDTNECGGLQDSWDGSKTIASINISGNTLVLHPQGEGPVSLQRVK